MTTGTVLVKRAFRRIGAHSELSPASAESLDEGFETLTSMMEMWLSRGIKIGFVPLEKIADDLNEPPDCKNGIIDNLAIQSAPNFDNGKVIVSDTLRNNARKEFSRIKTLYRSITVPNKVVSSTLPVGEGNRQPFGFGLRSQTYFQEGDEIEN